MVHELRAGCLPLFFRSMNLRSHARKDQAHSFYSYGTSKNDWNDLSVYPRTMGPPKYSQYELSLININMTLQVWTSQQEMATYMDMYGPRYQPSTPYTCILAGV